MFDLLLSHPGGVGGVGVVVGECRGLSPAAPYWGRIWPISSRDIIIISLQYKGAFPNLLEDVESQMFSSLLK